MQTTVRDCRQCQVNTDQWRSGIGSGLRRPWILRELALSPLMWWLAPWRCDVWRAG